MRLFFATLESGVCVLRNAHLLLFILSKIGVANRVGDLGLLVGDLGMLIGDFGATFSLNDSENDVVAETVLLLSRVRRTPGLEKLNTGGSFAGTCIKRRISLITTKPRKYADYLYKFV